MPLEMRKRRVGAGDDGGSLARVRLLEAGDGVVPHPAGIPPVAGEVAAGSGDPGQRQSFEVAQDHAAAEACAFQDVERSERGRTIIEPRRRHRLDRRRVDAEGGKIGGEHGEAATRREERRVVEQGGEARLEALPDGVQAGQHGAVAREVEALIEQGEPPFESLVAGSRLGAQLL